MLNIIYKFNVTLFSTFVLKVERHEKEGLKWHNEVLLRNLRPVLFGLKVQYIFLEHLVARRTVWRETGAVEERLEEIGQGRPQELTLGHKERPTTRDAPFIVHVTSLLISFQKWFNLFIQIH